MKRIICSVGAGLLLFALYWILGFFYVAAITNILFRFEFVNETQWFWIAFSGGIAVAIIALGITIAVLSSEKKTKIGNWWGQNYPTLLLYYVISAIFFISVRKEIIWKFDEMKDVLSLEWTIFGISIAIFLVWNILIIEYLKKHKPNIPQKADTFNLIKYIGEKGKFHSRASQLLNTVILLMANLIVLIVTTTIVHISACDVTIVSQNATVFSYYLCTNTILRLFLDILVPLNEEKKLMLQNTKVTTQDINYQNLVDDKIKKALTTMEEIEKLDNISDEQKKEIYSELIKNVAGMADNYPATLLEEGTQSE